MSDSLPLCIWFNEITRNDTSFAGGKGANLGDMVRSGLPVPPGFVITTGAYRQMLAIDRLDQKINSLIGGLDPDDNDSLQQVSNEIHYLFDATLVDSELSHVIYDFYSQMGDDVTVAVRSSSTAEDLASASFAGQQETYLNITGRKALLNAVKDCWASLYTPQAMFYRHQQGFDATIVSMAVVVQQLVDVEKAGVMFTVDPIMKNHFHIMIEAVWGLGEGLVSGHITPNSYKLDRDSFELVHEYVARQDVMVTKNGDGGIVTVDTPEDIRDQRVLSDDELKELVTLGLQVEQHFGSPQDIEWGIEKNQLYLLQSRPITNL